MTPYDVELSDGDVRRVYVTTTRENMHRDRVSRLVRVATSALMDRDDVERVSLVSTGETIWRRPLREFSR